MHYLYNYLAECAECLLSNLVDLFDVDFVKGRGMPEFFVGEVLVDGGPQKAI